MMLVAAHLDGDPVARDADRGAAASRRSCSRPGCISATTRRRGRLRRSATSSSTARIYSLARPWPGNLVFCSLAAYAFARITLLRSRRVVRRAPGDADGARSRSLLIPTFLIVKKLGMVDSVGGADRAQPVHAPSGSSCCASSSARCRSSSRRPRESTAPRGSAILFKIVLPLSMPALATLADHPFLWSWNDFLWPLIIIGSATHAPLSSGSRRSRARTAPSGTS